MAVHSTVNWKVPTMSGSNENIIGQWPLRDKNSRTYVRLHEESIGHLEKVSVYVRCPTWMWAPEMVAKHNHQINQKKVQCGTVSEKMKTIQWVLWVTSDCYDLLVNCLSLVEEQTLSSGCPPLSPTFSSECQNFQKFVQPLLLFFFGILR